MPVVTRSQAKKARRELAVKVVEKRRSKTKGKKQPGTSIEGTTIELVPEEKVMPEARQLEEWFNKVHIKYLQDIEDNQMNIWTNQLMYNINRMKLWTELLYHIRTYSEITGHINHSKYPVFIPKMIEQFTSAIRINYTLLMRGVPPRNEEEANAYKAFQSEAKLTTEFLSKFTNPDIYKSKIDNINRYIQGIFNLLNGREELKFY